MELVRAKAEGPRALGADPATGQQVYVMNGRYGAYVQLGETPEGKKAEKPKRSSLQGGMTESTVTLEEALKLLSLPRVVGLHPDDNEPITTNFGRFGPYVKHGDEFRSLESEDQVFSISFDDALALIRAPKQSRRRGQGGVEEDAARAHARGRHDQAARGPLRPLRDRRHRQRVAAEDGRSERPHLRAGDGAAERPARHGAGAQARRLQAQGGGRRAQGRPRPPRRRARGEGS